MTSESALPGAGPARLRSYVCAALLLAQTWGAFAQSPPPQGGTAPPAAAAPPEAVQKCVEAGAGAIFEAVNGPLAGTHVVPLFPTRERALLEITACPTVKGSPRADWYTINGGSGGDVFSMRARAGGGAGMRVHCEAPPPLWLLDEALDAATQMRPVQGHASDWVLSCEDIAVVDLGPGLSGESTVAIPPVAAPLGDLTQTHWKTQAFFRYPKIRFTLRPSSGRLGRTDLKVLVDLKNHVTSVSEYIGLNVDYRIAGRVERYSRAIGQIAEDAVGGVDQPTACGFTDRTKPDQEAPFRVEFSAYSPTAAITCGASTAAAALEDLKRDIECLKDRSKCPALPQPAAR